MNNDIKKDLDYINHLEETNGANLKGVEQIVFSEFKKTKNGIIEIKKRLQEIEEEKKNIFKAMNELAGRLEGFGDILLKAKKE